MSPGFYNRRTSRGRLYRGVPLGALIGGLTGGCGDTGLMPVGGLNRAAPPGETVADETRSARGPDKIRLFWDYHGTTRRGRGPEVGAAHPDLEGVIVRSVWRDVEPARGRFDFGSLEAEIDWWSARGKTVIIRNAVFVPEKHGGVTPPWFYDAGIEPIVFEPAPGAERDRVPRVWDSPLFPELLEEYVRALAERYDGDPRVAYMWVGVGHLGYTVADASPGGTVAFLDAGWTPAAWEAYIEAVMDAYARHFRNTPTLLAASPVWLRNFKFDAIAPAMRRLAVRAVRQGASLYLNGLDPDPEAYAATPFSEMLESVAGVELPAGFSVLVGDDWPLWVDEERRAANTHEADRDDAGFRAVLDTALAEWRRLDRRSDLILVLLQPEMSVTNPNDPEFRPAVREILTGFLKAERAPRTQP